MKRILLAGGGAFVAMMVTGMASFALMPALGNQASMFYKDVRAEQLPACHILAQLVTSFLLAYIYPMTYRGGAVWAHGLRYGVLMALLVSVPHMMHVYAIVDTTVASLWLPIVFTVFTFGVGGVVIAFIYGQSAARPAASIATDVAVNT